MPKALASYKSFPGINSISRDPWFRIWQEKGRVSVPLAVTSEQLLRTLLCLDGYDSPTASLSIQSWSTQIEYVKQALALTSDDSVFEVGCGAGAFLFGLQPYCRTVGGLDYSEPLLKIARKVLLSDGLMTAEAIRLPAVPKYDHVVSHGVFHYFPDQDYAARVVRKMAAKAVRTIAVLDVNDSAKREEAMARRREAYAECGHAHEEMWQLFLEREFFRTLADELNCRLRIDESIMSQAINSAYRYNAFLFK